MLSVSRQPPHRCRSNSRPEPHDPPPAPAPRRRELSRETHPPISMKKLACIGLLLLAAAGCSSGSQAARITGVLRAEGGTNLGAIAGFPGLIRAVQGGRTIAASSTKPDGSFELTVKPGTYIVVGGWQGQCAAPCNWPAGCGTSDPVHVTKQ